MIGEVIVSTDKVLSNPAGSQVNLHPFDENVHSVSISVCKIFESLDLYTDTIPALINVSYQNSSTNTEDWTEIESTPLFSWANDQSYLCKSFPIMEKNVKILHTAFGVYDTNMHIYLHKTGVLGSGLELKIDKNWFDKDVILLLELTELHLIPDEAKCSYKGMFEVCREEYISAAVNNVTGCILKYMR